MNSHELKLKIFTPLLRLRSPESSSWCTNFLTALALLTHVNAGKFQWTALRSPLAFLYPVSFHLPCIAF
jgi:hypothetical protein